MARVYKAYPEMIRRHDDPRLYDLEDTITESIHAVVEHRVEERGEDYWTIALPQTLKAILEKFDKYASEVAAKAFLEGGIVEKEVEEK